MVVDEIESIQFGAITQVIGVAYTYRPSMAMRRHLTQNTVAHHSSKHTNFSYFYKGDKGTIARHQQELYLRNDPVTGQLSKHWPEPELAILLGRHHEVIAYTLANDLTAITIEARGRTEEIDGTYVGKAWYRSGSLGPRFVPASAISDNSKLLIGLRVTRRGCIIYNQQYNTSRCLRPFKEIPDAIVNYYKQFGNCLPPSKQIIVESEGSLPMGTVIMLGTGLIVPQNYFCEHGDQLSVYCPNIGELTNTAVMEIPDT